MVWSLRSWVIPTLRSMSWWPLIVVIAAIVIAISGLVATGHPLPAELARMSYGALAGAATLSLHDRAQSLMQPTATGPRTRLARRVVLVAPAVLAVTLLARVIDDLTRDGRPSAMPTVLALVALFATGTAVQVWMHVRLAHHAADIGVAVTCGWVVAGAIVPSRVIPQAIIELWIDRSLLVLIAAAVVLVIGTGRAWA